MPRRALVVLFVLYALPTLAQPAGKDEAKEKDKPKWDVSNPPGPRHDVTIDVDEGTWMSVDVSPDGKDIVFDLLGDLYIMPIAGGAARALTTGIAWDMQPRFSPDGKRIAFTSDRGGGDNLWVMNRDGSDPKAVSSETFRLVNSPAWTPDGEFIVGRKHFTSKRSLGAGEIWMWHRSGGEGVQVTEKQTDQKDTGEPAFSPDGRYLYYSQDDTPGKTFEYNKDPNREIYVIHRYDRQRAEDDPFVTGAGGSIRPTPSPDGKSLAFLRRIRGKTVLMTADVATGAERIVTDGLDRDMQETWAIHGVYPQIAWTPDSRAIVYWAGGKIRRIDVASQKVAIIPFRVRGTRSVAETLRFPQEVAPPRFRPKMLRWATVSPDGKQVVFQALGRLYVKDLPNGKPRPLTKQRDHFEHYPAWSRDGRFIVYTSWHDEQGGAVRVVPAAGGEGRVVTPQPGHYVEPAFSPDGMKIVFRKSADGYLRTPRWGRDPGLYWVPTAGGTPRRIVKDGRQPVFSAAGDRIYFVRHELSPVDKEPDKMTLRSINLDGGEERSHLVSEEALEYRVSPDERWVAFVENFNIWLAPLPKTGKPVSISPRTKAYPVARLSRDAGEWLGWSGDSRRLHWSLGPELYGRDVKDAFAFVPGAPADLPKPAEKGLDLSFDADADVPDGVVAFVGGRVVTMRGDEVIEDGAVVVDKNRIVAVGPRRTVTVPPGAKTIDVAGTTVVPGLVDVHWHGAMGGEQIIPQQSWVDYATLAFGVTTLHDPSNDTAEIFAHSELGRAGLVVAPRIFSTGTVIYGAKGADLRAPIDSPDDARAHLRRIQAAGGFSVKSYNQPRREQRQEIIAAARDLGMMVVPEGASLFDLDMTFIVDGHTGVEHALPVANVYADVLALWSGSRTGYTPTLVVAYGGRFGEGWFYQHDAVWKNERLLTFVPRRFVDAAARRPTMIPDDELNHIAVARAVKALADKGVGVNLGAHGQREGLGAHWELAMMVQGGMTPHQALRAGTLSGARYLGLDKHIGSIEPGKLADLAIIDGNPLADISQSSHVRYTMVNGRLYDAATMNEIGNRPRPRKPFWFEGPDGNQGLPPGAR